MSDAAERFLQAIKTLDEVADEVTAAEARSSFDDATLQEFWRDWTHISSWSGALWRLLSEDLQAPATPVRNEDLDEIGGGGRLMSTLRDIMTADVYTVDGSTSVTEVARAMERGRFGSALVMESGWLAGIFTERDVLRAAASGTDLNTSAVSEWMTKDPTTAPPDMTTAEAMQIMAANGFRHLPVAEGKTVAGIVSLRDVLSTRIARTPR